MSVYLDRFADVIRTASEASIRADVALNDRLVIDRAGPLKISYAPFEHIQHSACVVIVGITPGAQQAANALCEARRRLLAGDDHVTALAATKIFASFSGQMRNNLVNMLDYIGIARWLGISSTAELWTEHSKLAHFTSALRYPVFNDGKNYNGTPPMERTPILTRLLDTYLREEADALPGAVWVPLGGKAEVGVQYLVRQGRIDPKRVLSGMLHPSGASSERVKYFIGEKPRAMLSIKTNPNLIDPMRDRLMRLVAQLAPCEVQAQSSRVEPVAGR